MSYWRNSSDKSISLVFQGQRRFLEPSEMILVEDGFDWIMGGKASAGIPLERMPAPPATELAILEALAPMQFDFLGREYNLKKGEQLALGKDEADLLKRRSLPLRRVPVSEAMPFTSLWDPPSEAPTPEPEPLPAPIPEPKKKPSKQAKRTSKENK